MQKVRTQKFVFILILLHLAIVLPLAYSLNIWADEASTLYTTQHGFLIAFQNAATDEKQAPLYFWILSLWRSIDGSIFFARLFSVICSAAAIRLFADIAKRFLEPRAALLVIAFFALHPFLIWASLEIRVYSLIILLTIILLRLFLKTFWDEADGQSRKAKIFGNIWFLFAAIIALYTNYYIGFLLVGFFAVLIWTKKWRQSRDYIGLMAIAFIAFFPLILVARAQYLANTGGFQEQRSLVEGLRILWSHVLSFLLPAEMFSGEDASPFGVFRVWVVRVALVGILFLTIWQRKNISRFTILTGIVTAVTGTFFLIAYFTVGPEFAAIRHASVLFAPLVLFFASLLYDVCRTFSERASKITAFAVGLLVLTSFSYSLIHLYPQMAKRGDWIRIGEFIRQNESPAQPIIIFSTFDALALPYHYHGINKILPDTKFFDFRNEAPFGTANSLKTETEFVISEFPPEANEVWLVVNEKCLVTEACVPLENYVRAHYTIKIEKEFYLEKLYLLRKKT